MSRSADLCLYVLALQNGLLGEAELDAALQEAVDRNTSLKAVLYENKQVHPNALERLLAQRQDYAVACAACRAKTYVMPGQEPTCEACGEPLGAPEAAAASEEPSGPPPPARPARGRRPARAGGPPRRGPPRKGPPRRGPPRKGPPGRRPVRGRPPRPAPPAAEPAGEDPANPPGLTSSDYGVSSKRPASSDESHEGDEAQGRELSSGDYRVSSEDARAHATSKPEPATRPQKKPSAPPADDPEGEAKATRLAGGGFGYEPPDESEKIERPRRRLGTGHAGPAPAAVGPGGGDAAFRPPAEHLAQVAGPEPVHVPPLRQDLGRLLTLPVRTGEAIGALVIASLFMLFLGFVPCYALPVFLLTVCYPYAFLARITEWAVKGSDEIPGWPEFNPLDLIFLGGRVLATTIACYLPAFLLLIPLTWASLVAFAGAQGSSWKSIGPDAHDMAPAEPYVAAGTDAAQVVFTRVKDDEEVRLDQGSWTIVGLLGKDTADDTGVSRELQDAPVGGWGAVIWPKWQPWDLDRVGQALPGVRVLGAYADPARKEVHARWAFLRPPEDEEDRGHDDEDDEDAEDAEDDELGEFAPDTSGDLEAARGTAELAGRATGAGDEYFEGVYRVDPFKKLEVVVWPEFLFPEPFKAAPRSGAIYVVDPTGKVVREYATGVYDQKLYADVRSLMAGGRGDVSPQTLPGNLSPGGMGLSGGLLVALWVLVGALYLLGSFYWPIAWLMMVNFTSATMPFMYGTGIRAIKAGLPDYLALTGVFIAVAIGTVVVQSVLGLFLPPWLLKLVLGFVFMYGQIVVAHGIGRYFLANRQAIGWF